MMCLSPEYAKYCVEHEIRAPREKPVGCDDRMSFFSGLTTAVIHRDEDGSLFLLEELTRLYPKDVTAQMAAAEKAARKLLAEVDEEIKQERGEDIHALSGELAMA